MMWSDTKIKQRTDLKVRLENNGKPDKYIKVTCEFMRQHGNYIEKQFRDIGVAMKYYNGLILEQGVVKSISLNGTVSLLLLKKYR